MSDNWNRPGCRLGDDAIPDLAAVLLEEDGAWHIGAGDFSLLGLPATFSYGYTVWGRALGLKNPYQEEVEAWLRQLMSTDRYYPLNTTVNSWRDEDGTTRLGVGDWFPYLADAVAVAQDRKQDRVWDWAQKGWHVLTKQGGLRFEPYGG